MAPHLIYDLLVPLVAHRFHPPTLKRADRIGLDKPWKPAHDSTTAFRVIVLLQTFSKMQERIMNSRLSYMAGPWVLLNQ